MVRQPLNLFASLRLTRGLWYVRGLFVGPMCIFYKSKDPLELLDHSPHDLKAQQPNQSLLCHSCLTSPHFREGWENYKEPLSIHLFSITSHCALMVAEAEPSYRRAKAECTLDKPPLGWQREIKNKKKHSHSHWHQWTIQTVHFVIGRNLE